MPEAVSDETLLSAAISMLPKAYCPYSKFPVGAALLCEDGTVITGVNVENASYGGTICAERSAFVSAVSQGKRKFKTIAIATELEAPAAPCGLCRQFMVEFGNVKIILGSSTSDQTLITTIKYNRNSGLGYGEGDAQVRDRQVTQEEIHVGIKERCGNNGEKRNFALTLRDRLRISVRKHIERVRKANGMDTNEAQTAANSAADHALSHTKLYPSLTNERIVDIRRRMNHLPPIQIFLDQENDEDSELSENEQRSPIVNRNMEERNRRDNLLPRTPYPPINKPISLQWDTSMESEVGRNYVNPNYSDDSGTVDDYNLNDTVKISEASLTLK